MYFGVFFPYVLVAQAYSEDGAVNTGGVTRDRYTLSHHYRRWSNLAAA